MDILKQRRVWAAISGVVALIVNTFFDGQVDAEETTNAIVGVIESVATLATVVLSIWSYVKPKTAKSGNKK